MEGERLETFKPQLLRAKKGCRFFLSGKGFGAEGSRRLEVEPLSQAKNNIPEVGWRPVPARLMLTQLCKSAGGVRRTAALPGKGGWVSPSPLGTGGCPAWRGMRSCRSCRRPGRRTRPCCWRCCRRWASRTRTSAWSPSAGRSRCLSTGIEKDKISRSPGSSCTRSRWRGEMRECVNIDRGPIKIAFRTNLSPFHSPTAPG